MQNLSNWWSLFCLGFLQELFDNVISSFGLSSSLSFQAKKKNIRGKILEKSVIATWNCILLGQWYTTDSGIQDWEQACLVSFWDHSWYHPKGEKIIFMHRDSSILRACWVYVLLVRWTLFWLVILWFTTMELFVEFIQYFIGHT